jgi:hypothetical protein
MIALLTATGRKRGATGLARGAPDALARRHVVVVPTGWRLATGVQASRTT